MADAYDVMNLAKRYGAAAKNFEAWETYQDELRAFKEKKGKGSFWGGLAQLGMAAALPLLIPATGGTALGLMGTIGKGLMSGLKRSAITEVVRRGVSDFAEGDNPMAKFKGAGGYWGMGQEKEMGRKSRSVEKDLLSQIAGQDRGALFTSILSGFMPELKELGKLGTEGWKEVGKEAKQLFYPKVAPVELSDIAQQTIDNPYKLMEMMGENQWKPNVGWMGGDNYTNISMEESMLDKILKMQNPGQSWMQENVTGVPFKYRSYK